MTMLFAPTEGQTASQQMGTILSKIERDDARIQNIILPARDPGTKLTPREIECSYWMMLGKARGDIAMIMGIGHHTASDYFKSIYSKLGVNSKTEFAHTFAQHNPALVEALYPAKPLPKSMNFERKLILQGVVMGMTDNQIAEMINKIGCLNTPKTAASVADHVKRMIAAEDGVFSRTGLALVHRNNFRGAAEFDKPLAPHATTAALAPTPRAKAAAFIATP